MKYPILNLENLEYYSWGNGKSFQANIGAIGQKVGAKQLGYNLTVLSPGKRAYPFHSHRVNEEMFFVIEGEGEIRIGKERYPIRKGDVIACPAGNTETAHQITNTSTAELKYLAVSTQLSPEIAEYPDTGKYGIMGRFRVDKNSPPEVLTFITREQGNFDAYWEGEE